MSTLNVANITDGTDTVETGYVVNGSARAWVTVSAAGSTLDIENSFNVSSEFDHDVGDYSFNLSNAFTDEWFSQQVTCRSTAYDKTCSMNSSRITTSVMATEVGDAHAQIRQDINIVITAHGDLA